MQNLCPMSIALCCILAVQWTGKSFLLCLWSPRFPPQYALEWQSGHISPHCSIILSSFINLLLQGVERRRVEGSREKRKGWGHWILATKMQQIQGARKRSFYDNCLFKERLTCSQHWTLLSYLKYKTSWQGTCVCYSEADN